MRRVSRRVAPAVALVVFALWWGSYQAHDVKWLDVGTEAMYLAGAAVGLNILLGWTGLLSLGHAGFFVAGGYAGGLIVVGDPWLGFVPAFVVGALLGAALALMCCHLRGFYLTVVTLAFGALVPAIVTVFDSQLGGPAGRALDDFPDTTRVGVYYTAVAYLLVTLAVAWVVRNSRRGRALLAIRESEAAAQASGIDVYWHKVGAFALSAGIVAVAGWLAALRFLTVSSGSASDVSALSFRYVIVIVLGGIGTLAGPVLGAFLFTFGTATGVVQEVFRDEQGLFLGGLGLALVALAPEGLVGLLRRFVPPSPPTVRISPLSRRRNPHSSSDPVVEVVGLVKRFGGVAALSDLDLRVRRGTVHALIGPNGSGKSTFVNVLSGLERPNAGRVVFAGVDVTDMAAHRRARLGMARTFQNIRIWPRMTVLEHADIALLDQVGLADRAHTAAGTLPFADQRRLEIARALTSNPALLLLDEPAAGMHAGEVDELRVLLAQVRDSGVTVLLVEHHMELVMGLSDVVTVIDYGIKISEGRPDQVRTDARVIEAYLGC